MLHLLALAYLSAGRGREAAETYFRIRHPEDEPGLSRELAGLAPEAAIAAVERRLRRRAGAEDSDLMTYATALLAAGQSARAFDQFRRAIEVGRTPEGFRGLARANAERAIPIFQGIARESPDDTRIMIAFADAYRRVGRKEDAIAQCEAYARIYPERKAEVLGVLALLEPEKGLPRLRAECESDPENVDAWVSLGDACRELGKPADARAAYERAVAGGLTDPWLRARIASVR